MKFDFTPDPKVLIALTHTPMQPLDALCELIDNAIDSFYGAKIQGLKTDNPMVIVTLPSRKQLSDNGGILRIQDNGPGMSPQQAEKAIKAGFSGNNPYDTLGKYGLHWDKSIEQESVIRKCKTNIPVLKRVDDKCMISDIQSDTHIFTEGDNFHALTTLNMMCGNEGFVDAIYINPPYNRGEEDFRYNDKFVDKEDGYKHSKDYSYS